MTDLMMVITGDVVWDWLLKCYLKEDDMLLNYWQKDDVKKVWYVLSEEIADNYEFCSLKSMYSAKKAPTVDQIAYRYMNCWHIEDMVLWGTGDNFK